MWRRLELRRVESQLEQPETSVKVDELASVLQSSLVQFPDSHHQISLSVFRRLYILAGG